MREQNVGSDVIFNDCQHSQKDVTMGICSFSGEKLTCSKALGQN